MVATGHVLYPASLHQRGSIWFDCNPALVAHHLPEKSHPDPSINVVCRLDVCPNGDLYCLPRKQRRHPRDTTAIAGGHDRILRRLPIRVLPLHRAGVLTTANGRPQPLRSDRTPRMENIPTVIL